MSAPTSLANLSFLTPGNYPDEDPAAGLEDTLRLFEFGERLGVDGAWVRQRHLEHGVGSAAVFLAAAGQRTRRIQLGTAVIPIGYESPFRLAEDLAMADILSGGRLISPPHRPGPPGSGRGGPGDRPVRQRRSHHS
ncbi:LLM class flavin-dependent oxidoreductase [Nocardia rhamnosiphila]|uniref:LLM class flavin-dependent oxidoreductase n=1 Tax=Nocardia rhamnosiphila TaxID=426716 RepID=UPI000AECE117|nr:LLM class flavin-dependent oxidoreductase [Nocardia rhamnosiphila]